MSITTQISGIPWLTAAALLVVPVILAVSGCAQQPNITVMDFSQPTAEFRDTYENYDEYKAEVYFIAEIDGAPVKNAMSIAREDRTGRGFKMRIADYPRWLPVRQMTLHLRATVQTGAPIQAIAGKIVGSYKSAERTLVFMPTPGGRYAAKGTLNGAVPDVWLEDLKTGERFR